MNEEKMIPTLSEAEIDLARSCMEFAREHGAEQVRITLTKSLMNLTGVLNGEVDKVAHALDRSIQIQLFVDGRFGSFSNNRLERQELETFILNAIETVRMLEPDPFRCLPDAARLEKGAVSGRELGLYDPAYDGLDAAGRKALALRSMFWPSKAQAEKGFRLIAEEGEYSDSVFDSVTLDSQGLYARHTETSFEIGYEATVEDAEGRHFSNYWWDAAPLLKDLKLDGCAEEACRRAAALIGPRPIGSGSYTVVVDSECAGKLVTPLLNALGGYALQQKNSFLQDSLGEKRFPENMTILDTPRVPGQTGCRLFDSEGVATRDMPIIEKGVVKTWFINSYIAKKMNIAPTIEDATRVVVLPTGGCKTRKDVLRAVGNGILVTGFNGGNSNPATGNFSYGIEGFLVEDGKISFPVRELLMTGDFLTLWNNLAIVAEDARPCMSKLVPTLAFKHVSISA